MSFSTTPYIDLNVKRVPDEGLSLLLPWHTRFRRMGIKFEGASENGNLARANLPKNWICSVSTYDKGKTLYLYDGSVNLRAKIIFEETIDIQFPKF